MLRLLWESSIASSICLRTLRLSRSFFSFYWMPYSRTVELWLWHCVPLKSIWTQIASLEKTNTLICDAWFCSRRSHSCFLHSLAHTRHRAHANRYCVHQSTSENFPAGVVHYPHSTSYIAHRKICRNVANQRLATKIDLFIWMTMSVERWCCMSFVMRHTNRV